MTPRRLGQRRPREEVAGGGGTSCAIDRSERTNERRSRTNAARAPNERGPAERTRPRRAATRVARLAAGPLADDHAAPSALAAPRLPAVACVVEARGGGGGVRVGVGRRRGRRPADPPRSRATRRRSPGHRSSRRCPVRWARSAPRPARGLGGHVGPQGAIKVGRRRPRAGAPPARPPMFLAFLRALLVVVTTVCSGRPAAPVGGRASAAEQIVQICTIWGL